MTKPGVLFMCVYNSARSQLAEGLARAAFGEWLRVESAGSQPAGVNPLVPEVLAELGIKNPGARSKRVDDLDMTGIELVVTLCAEEVCPVVLAPLRKLHWPTEDPVRADDPMSDTARARFRQTCVALHGRLALIESALDLPPRTVVAPATAGDRPELEALLVGAGLPLNGLDDAFPDRFVLARIDRELVGAAALERWGNDMLLRSVAVAESHRGQGIAAFLVADRLVAARMEGAEAVYLLTLSAGEYFERQGFIGFERTRLPPALAASTQVSLPACAKAVAMVKVLGRGQD
jgi:protein-tyrosine-phosphatase/N-acetylglutamate synthase-like GNAT family acetyltransferase